MNDLTTLPDFTLPVTSHGEINLNEIKGKNIVLYFYPKDSTPGCTMEGKDFRDNYEKFQSLNTEIFGVSKDNLNSHEKFKTKQNFPFELIADIDAKLCNNFNVIKEKSLFGKKYLGIVRSTFLFDKNGVLVKEWRNVKIRNHVNEVLQAVKDI